MVDQGGLDSGANCERHRDLVALVSSLSEPLGFAATTTTMPQIDTLHGWQEYRKRGTFVMAEEIVISTANPHDIMLEEVEEIATAIRGLNLNCDVRVEAKEREGYGVTLFEVLRVCLSGVDWASKEVAKETAKKIMTVVIDKIRERFQGRRHGSKRSVYVKIYGPDGTILSTVKKNEPEGLEDRTAQDQQTESNFKNRKK